jgi:hypothetical protein
MQDEEEATDGDEEDEEEEEEEDSQVLRQEPPRRYPRSKAQVMVDRAKDSMQDPVNAVLKLDLSGVGAC